jgi:hypothetical protein
MELNIEEIDFDINEMNELASTLNDFNTNYDTMFANPLSNNTNSNTKKTVFNQMSVASQKQPTSCQVKRQLIKESLNKFPVNPVKQCEPVKIVKPTQQCGSVKTFEPIKMMKSEQNTQTVQNTIEKPSQINYDDILNRLNVQIVDGQMQFIQRSGEKGNKSVKGPTPQQLQPSQSVKISQNNQNNQNKQPIDQAKLDSKSSYIYNKYFNEPVENEGPKILRPRNIEEYKKMVLHQIYLREQNNLRLNQIKSKKLIMPNSNINVANGSRPQNLNKLFGFVGR